MYGGSPLVSRLPWGGDLGQIFMCTFAFFYYFFIYLYFCILCTCILLGWIHFEIWPKKLIEYRLSLEKGSDQLIVTLYTVIHYLYVSLNTSNWFEPFSEALIVDLEKRYQIILRFLSLRQKKKKNLNGLLFVHIDNVKI